MVSLIDSKAKRHFFDAGAGIYSFHPGAL